VRVRADEQVERKDSAWVPTYLKKERGRRKKEEDLWEGRVDVEFSFRFFFTAFLFSLSHYSFGEAFSLPKEPCCSLLRRAAPRHPAASRRARSPSRWMRMTRLLFLSSLEAAERGSRRVEARRRGGAMVMLTRRGERRRRRRKNASDLLSLNLLSSTGRAPSSRCPLAAPCRCSWD
jgi:hypothetical protein